MTLLENDPEDLMKQIDPWVTLEKIQQVLGWSQNQFLESLGLSEKKYLQLKRTKTSPSLYVVNQFTSSVGLSIEHVVTGNIDYSALKAHMTGNPFHLPEKYAVAAFSKRRTSINLMKYLERRLGWAAKKYILNHFQLTEAIFSDPEAKINYRFPTELCLYLDQSGYHHSIFPEMGAYSLVTNRDTELGRIMRSFGSPKVMHERIFDGLAGAAYDQNCEYRILQSNKEYCLLQAKFTQELKELLKENKPGNRLACAVRGGTFMSLTGYLNLPFSEVTEQTCVHLGDDACTYRIKFEQAEHLYGLEPSVFH